MLNIINKNSIVGDKKNRNWSIKGAIALALLAMLGAGCAENRPEATAPGQTGTTVEQVTENTNKLIGQTVTVKGEVEEVLGTRTFRIEDNQIFNNDKVLVINPTPVGNTLTEGKNVQVTGEVRQFVIAEFERDYDLTWDLDLKKKIEAEYEGKPVIVATSTQLVQ